MLVPRKNSKEPNLTTIENKTLASNNSSSNLNNKIGINSSSSKGINTKGLNVIPIKNLNIHRENITNTTNFNSNSNDKSKLDRLSPKPKEKLITTGIGSNISPRNKLSPTSNKNITNEKVGIDNKYSSRIYANISSNLAHKSPSPKPHDNKTKILQDKKAK